MDRPLHISILTDEIAPVLADALGHASAWGLSHFELREGQEGRFPAFTPDEIAAVEEAIRGGAKITAVSPGIFKSSVEDTARLRRELDDVLPRTLDLAARFGCPLVIAFGFERAEGEPDENRSLVLHALETAAERAGAAGLKLAVENEPAFWTDRAEDAAALVRDIGHPALGLNWDPANLHWGGHFPTHADFEAVRPHLFNLHVKDWGPGRPEAPWWPLGEGATPWPDLFRWVLAESDLPGVTLETHVVPALESSRQSLASMRHLIADARAHLNTTRSAP